MTLAPVDLNDPRFQTDRYGYIEELRTQNFWAPTTNNARVFFNQNDVQYVLACEDFQFAFNTIDEARSPYLAKAIRHELLNMHGAAHQRLSRLVKQALRDRVIEHMRAKIETIVSDLIAELPNDGEIEFCTNFADPLPARVLGPMFGIPYDQVEGLDEWIKVGGRKSDALQSGVGIEEVEEANRNIHDYLRALLDTRKTELGDDLFSELMLAEIDGDRMNADELVYLTSELASAGVDTTRIQLPLILHALLTHPAQLAKLQAEPGLALRAVDEGMRFAPLPWVLPHVATRDFVYKGLSFAKGDLVFVMVPAANRDPAAIKDPNSLDITRGRARHFGFGAGMHGCPGAQLARMEMSIALRALVERLEVFELAGSPIWEPDQVGRTLRALPLRVKKRTAA